MDKLRSVSHVAVLAPSEQAAVLDQVREILRDHPATRGRDLLDMPYRADVMVTTRLPA